MCSKERTCKRGADRPRNSLGRTSLWLYVSPQKLEMSQHRKLFLHSREYLHPLRDPHVHKFNETYTVAMLE